MGITIPTTSQEFRDHLRASGNATALRKLYVGDVGLAVDTFIKRHTPGVFAYLRWLGLSMADATIYAEVTIQAELNMMLHNNWMGVP